MQDKVDVESLERENDKGLDALSERVSLLKAATAGIRGEVDSQDRTLDDMGGGMGGISAFLAAGTSKFKTVMSDKKNNNFMFGVIGMVVLLFLLWYYTQM